MWTAIARTARRIRFALGRNCLFCLFVLPALLWCGPLGCGSAPFYPNALILDDGSEIHFAVLEAIANDPDLTEAQKRRILEDELGIEDQDFQDFILNNF